LLFHKNTAAEKIQTVINKMMELRNSEEKRLLENPQLGLGDVTSLNLTMLSVSLNGTTQIPINST